MPGRREDIYDHEVHYMYYEEDMSLHDIADYYGVSFQCIYYRLHPEKSKKDSKKYLKTYNGKVTRKESKKTWLQTDNGKSCTRKCNAHRRCLGSISINKPFDDSEFHHFSKEHGIHIPAEIHKSITHNIWTGKNMEAINKEAFEFLDYELREEAWSKITGDWRNTN